jgi:5'-nucleotidase
MTRDDFPAETLLNVNLPAGPAGRGGGCACDDAGPARIRRLTDAGGDPNGREYFWIGGGESKWWGGPESDFRASTRDFISVTPLHLDLTNYKLWRTGGWDLKL